MTAEEMATELASLNIPVVSNDNAELTPEQEALIAEWTDELAAILANPRYPVSVMRAGA